MTNALVAKISNYYLIEIRQNSYKGVRNVVDILNLTSIFAVEITVFLVKY